MPAQCIWSNCQPRMLSPEAGRLSGTRELVERPPHHFKLPLWPVLYSNFISGGFPRFQGFGVQDSACFRRLLLFVSDRGDGETEVCKTDLTPCVHYANRQW